MPEEENLGIGVRSSFLFKLKAFNKMASITIKKNKLKGKEALTTRFVVIQNSFKLFNTIRLQQKILGISVIGLIRTAKLQKALNEAGVAYTFPGIQNITNPAPPSKEAQMEQALRQMDVTKMPKN